LAQELPTEVLMTNISIQRTAFSIGIVSSLEIIVSQRSDFFLKQDLAKTSTIAKMSPITLFLTVHLNWARDIHSYYWQRTPSLEHPGESLVVVWVIRGLFHSHL
jgi:hypothetical protein